MLTCSGIEHVFMRGVFGTNLKPSIDFGAFAHRLSEFRYLLKNDFIFVNFIIRSCLLVLLGNFSVFLNFVYNCTY